MDIDILSLFPDYFSGPFDESILKRARQKKILNIHHVNVRDFTQDKHHRVDDRPFGGGPGMVLMAPPLRKAIRSVKRMDSKVIYLSPQGNLLTADVCQKLAAEKHLILVCGHYEGIDERIIESEIDEEISIGDYVLTNGALAAIVLIDAMARFLPGVLGHVEAANEDSFQNGLLDCPHYTRPEEYEGLKVPAILLQGNHHLVDGWRKEQALKKTKARRPDLFYTYLAKKVKEEVPQTSSEEDELGIVMPVRNLKSSADFYRKTMRLTLLCQSDERLVFRVGGQEMIFVSGEPKTEIAFRWTMPKQELTSLRARLVKGRVEKLQTKAEEMTFQDLNGYFWVLLETSSFKGE